MKLLPAYKVRTRDPAGGERTWLILDGEDIEDVLRAAAKAAALDNIRDYETYRSDSAYLDALDRAAEHIELLHYELSDVQSGGRAITTRAYLLDEAAPNKVGSHQGT